MNIRPDAVSVLCYGDSNTWGQKPDKSGRYPSDVRWTGKLQEFLGEGYYVIEEGLSSRTTDLDYTKPGRNGKSYLLPCIASHNPIDIVVLMLGTNDLKTAFNRTANEVAAALSGLIDDIKANAWNKEKAQPRIILMSPILINSKSPRFHEFYEGKYDEESEMKSKELAGKLQKIADSQRCYFLDACTVAEPGIDGLHFSESSNTPLAQLVSDRVKDLQIKNDVG